MSLKTERSLNNSVGCTFKIRILIKTDDLAEYRRFLPSGTRFDQLTDLIFYYVGYRVEFDVQLSLPARLAPPARLGQSGELGWTAWLAPPPAAEGVWLKDARFDPMEQRRERAARHAQAAHQQKAGRQP